MNAGGVTRSSNSALEGSLPALLRVAKRTGKIAEQTDTRLIVAQVTCAFLARTGKGSGVR
jgi:hypothetical protein